jgi:hypothetical protein
MPTLMESRSVTKDQCTRRASAHLPEVWWKFLFNGAVVWIVVTSYFLPKGTWPVGSWNITEGAICLINVAKIQNVLTIDLSSGSRCHR